METLAWIDKQMKDKGIDKYNLYTDLIAVTSNAPVEYEQKNDIYFLIHAFTDSGVLAGTILSADNALELKPHIMSTVAHKLQAFRGKISIYCNNENQIMYVELIIASPIR